MPDNQSNMEPSITVNVKRLLHSKGLELPGKMTPGSSGCDIAAAVDSDFILARGERALIPTGFCFEVPQGYEVQIRPRSGLAIKFGITVLNSPGTIDSDYRGEIKIILINLSSEDFIIHRGDRIAQAVVMEVPCNIIYKETESISQSQRDSGGFGHSGI